MIRQIRYRLLMRRLRGEIAQIVRNEQRTIRSGKKNSAVVTACKAYGSIV